MLIPAGRKNLHHIPRARKRPAEVDIIALKLDIHELIEELVSGNLLTWPKLTAESAYSFGEPKP